jgi:hypothetical protein
MIKLGENNMKKFLVALLLLVPAQSFAAGPFDGIWEIKPYGYAIVSENNNEMIIVAVYNDDYGGDWVASRGTRTDNKARITNITGEGNIISDIEIKTDTIAEITQVSCIPNIGYECLLPDGYKITATKVW